MQKSTQSYVQTQFSTVGQGELLLMLYDGALRFLAQAREKMEARDYAAKGILISRALDVINELDSSLNQQMGGDLAKNLHQLYFLCSTKLLQANLRMSTELLDSAAEILTGLRNAYAQIQGKPEVQAAENQIALRQQHSAVPTRRPMAPPPAAPTGVTRPYAQNAYETIGTAAVTPDPSQQAGKAAQAAMRVAEKAAGQLTRQVAERATAALNEAATTAEREPLASPPLEVPSPAGQATLRHAATARYGKMQVQA